MEAKYLQLSHCQNLAHVQISGFCEFLQSGIYSLTQGQVVPVALAIHPVPVLYEVTFSYTNFTPWFIVLAQEQPIAVDVVPFPLQWQ